MAAPPSSPAPLAPAPQQQLSTTRARRLVIYNLIAGQHLINYLCRLSIPFVVPFICAECNYSDLQRAMLLNAFAPGYVSTQIPAAAMINRIGAKAVLTLNNAGMLVAFALLPTAAATGATAVAACVTLLGIVQGPYVTATSWMTKHWVPPGPERPLGIMVIRNGSNIAKVLAAALTPRLCGRFGWRAVPYFYAVVVGIYVTAWSALSASQPPPLRALRDGAPPLSGGGSSGGSSSNADAAEPKATATATAATAATSKAKAKEAGGFNLRELLQLMGTRPFKSLFLCQLAHNLGELHIFGPWAPTYFVEVLGVPMEGVGRYMQWPVLLAILMKLSVGITESKMLSRGWPQLYLRKLAVWISSVLNWCGIAIFATARAPAVATLGQVLIYAGSSFDSQAGFLPNSLEVCDKDIGYLGATLNTMSWLVCFLLATPLSYIKMTFGWKYLFGFPALLRVVSTIYFSKYADIRPARAFLLKNQSQSQGQGQGQD